jgi:hypothetical protein
MHLFKLAVLYLEFSPPDKYDYAFPLLTHYLEKLRWTDITYFRINNRQEGTGIIKREGDTVYLYGDNENWEFSGWQKGMDFIVDNKLTFDVVLMVNSSFEAPGPSFLRDYTNLWTITRSALLKQVIGRIDSHGLDTVLNGQDTKFWVCTNCVFLPLSALLKLKNIVSIHSGDLERYLPVAFEGASRPFREDAPMNEVYKAHIVEWLTQNWHSKIELSPDTWSLFRAKVKAIFNEALFSVRLRELGFPIVSYGKKKYY